MVYQPIVNHSQNTVVGYESLSRPLVGKQLVQPDIWFQVAYQCKRFVQADLLALTSALKGVATSGSLVPIFVNVLPRSLLDTSFLVAVESALADRVCRPGQLVIEIVEHVSYNPLSLICAIRDLRAMGVRVALDDVGMGGSSLGAMVELDPDFIKMDRSLIQGVSTSASKQRLLSHLVNYMESGDCVIAEGIETQEDLTAVQQCGVNLSQGYLWSHPLQIEDCVKFKL